MKVFRVAPKPTVDLATFSGVLLDSIRVEITTDGTTLSWKLILNGLLRIVATDPLPSKSDKPPTSSVEVVACRLGEPLWWLNQKVEAEHLETIVDHQRGVVKIHVDWSEDMQQTAVRGLAGQRIIHTGFHAARDDFRHQVSEFAKPPQRA